MVQSTPSPGGRLGSIPLGVSCPSAKACTAAGPYVKKSGAELTLAERYAETRGGYFSSRTAWPLSLCSSATTPRNLPVGKSKAMTWSWPTQ